MEKKYYTNGEYVTGSAARQLQPVWEMPEQQERAPERIERSREQIEPRQRRKPKVGHGIDFISMVLLVSAMIATLFVCIEYLQVQSDIVQLNKAVNATENQISAANKENNALEAVINAAASDLEYIYQVAVGTLGMVYPNNNEVVYYEQNEEGYFRQYQDIPQ